MPRSKASQKSQNASVAVRDSSDEELSTQTQSIRTFDKSAIERRVNEVVRYLLIAEQRRNPIKKSDINKHVIKEMSRHSNDIISSAKSTLEKVFAIELKELDGKQKTYILLNMFASADPTMMQWPVEEEPKLGLLMLVLTNIFMSGTVTERKMWKDLEALGIDPDEKHPVFGDVRRLILTDWVRQGYIERSVATNADPGEQELLWGQRTCAETTRSQVLQFACDMLGREGREFPQQYRQAHPEDAGEPGPMQVDDE